MDNTMNSAIYIELPQLGEYAASAAKLLSPESEGSGRTEARRLPTCCRELRRSHAEIARRYGTVTSPPAACEWLLDNWYMIEREYRGVLPQIEGARRRCCCSPCRSL